MFPCKLEVIRCTDPLEGQTPGSMEDLLVPL
jgi:hypothetical protein